MNFIVIYGDFPDITETDATTVDDTTTLSTTSETSQDIEKIQSSGNNLFIEFDFWKFIQK